MCIGREGDAMKLALFGTPLVCWSLLACTGHAPTTTSTDQSLNTQSPVARAPMTPPPAQVKLADVDSPSIYDLRVSLRDEAGTTRPLDALRGHPVLITMFYGSCPVACPLLMSDLKRLERQIPEPLRSDVRILMVSFDPERDTPTALARLKQERGLGASWTLASTGDDEARELAGSLNIKYRRVDDGVFFHSSVIVLLDRQGRPQARVEGADKDAAAILATLSAPSI
jgi:protein SCO1